jgi:hypothetical protein
MPLATEVEEGGGAARNGASDLSNVHVAIVDAATATKLASGHKRIESRLARHRRLPYGRVSKGDRIYFKVSGGNIIGLSRVRRVLHFDDLTPPDIDALRSRYNPAILASPRYWIRRRHCRYGVLIWLSSFCRRRSTFRVPRQFGNGWLLLPRPGR